MSENNNFLYECLSKCPSGVLQLDVSGAISYVNPALEYMLGIQGSQLLGLNRETLPLPVYRSLLDDTGGMVHLTGPGVHRESWLRASATIKHSDGRLLRYFEDVTDTQQMQQLLARLSRQVEELTITDQLTGLANQRALMQTLNVQVTRSRRYQNPLCLALIELQDKTDPNAVFSDEVILATSQHLRDRLRWVDVIARWDHNHFFIILPETNLHDGTELILEIRDWFTEVSHSGADGLEQLNLCIGVAEWQKGNDPRLLMERATNNLRAGFPVEKVPSALGGG